MADMNFYVGQRVTCVWAPRSKERKGFGDETWPQVGSTYTIRDIECINPTDGPGIRLVEVVNEPRSYLEGFVEVNFDPRRFRAFEALEAETSAEIEAF